MGYRQKHRRQRRSVFLERIKKLVNRLKKKSYLNKLPRNTEVRIFLKFKENSGTFFLKKKKKEKLTESM